MIKNIASVKFRCSIGKFFYDDVPDLTIQDKCIINTDEGIEIGTVIGFDKIFEETAEELIEEKNKTIDNNTESKDNINELTSEKKCCGECESSKKETNETSNIGGNINSTENAVKDEKTPDTKLKNDKNKIYTIIRKATKEDIEKFNLNAEEAKVAFKVCKEKIVSHKLDIKLVSSYYFLDRAKLLFEFISDQRVDFRELVKDLASYFKTRIELRQIGVRDEARSIGGCGVCGRELCCNIVGSGFETITIKMAKEQGMPLNTVKISGQCGRLMCCLGHEYQTYCEIKKDLPKPGTQIIFNNVPAVIRDINPLSRKLFIETEDKRFLYIDMKNVKEENGSLVATIVAE